MQYQPDVFHISTASPEDHMHPYRWVNNTQGNTCPVVHSRFARGSATEIDAYAKYMDMDSYAGRIELLNEISGWLLAKASGLPVSPSAFVAGIVASDLPANPPPEVRYQSGNDVLYFFCTEEITRSQVTGIIVNETLANEQAAWAHSHATLALDEWLGNADRNLGNLVRRAKDDFVLIDHGRMLARSPLPPWWKLDELGTLQTTKFANLLHHNTYRFRNVTNVNLLMAGFTKSAGFAHAQAKAMRSALFEIAYWCHQVAPGHSSEWLEYLVERVKNAREMLADRFGVFD